LILAVRPGSDHWAEFCKAPLALRPLRCDGLRADGCCNNRVVKFNKDGRFVAQSGIESRQGTGEFSLSRGRRGDRHDNVSVADRSNFHDQVLDDDLEPKAFYGQVGVGRTACVSRGRTGTCSPPTPTPIPMAIWTLSSRLNLV
jgi:hypothetical protein